MFSVHEMGFICFNSMSVPEQNQTYKRKIVASEISLSEQWMRLTGSSLDQIIFYNISVRIPLIALLTSHK